MLFPEGVMLTGKYVRPTVGDLPGRKSQLDFEPFGVGIPSGVFNHGVYEFRYGADKHTITSDVLSRGPSVS